MNTRVATAFAYLTTILTYPAGALIGCGLGAVVSLPCLGGDWPAHVQMLIVET